MGESIGLCGQINDSFSLASQIQDNLTRMTRFFRFSLMETRKELIMQIRREKNENAIVNKVASLSGR